MKKWFIIRYSIVLMFVIQFFFRFRIISQLAYNKRIEKELYESAHPRKTGELQKR
jgi:hypothetical protein